MALDLTAARAAMVKILETALGATVQVAVAPDQMTPPCLLVGMPTVDYHTTAGGLDEAEWPLFAVLPRTHDVAAVECSDRWVSSDGPESVRKILMADQTWAGTITGVFIRRAVAEISDYQLPSYRWDMEVKG